MLLYSFEKQLGLATVFVKRGDGQRWQGGIVGEEYQSLAQLWIFETDTPQMLWVALGDVKTIQRGCLTAYCSSVSPSARLMACLTDTPKLTDTF
jgi:hypothetical protein